MGDYVARVSEAEDGITAIRDTAKWMAVAFAGVGSVFVSGVQLSTLGSSASPLVLTALVFVVVALGGVAIGLHAISKVIAAPHYELQDVVREPSLERMGSLRPPFSGASQLQSQYLADIERRDRAWEDYLAAVEAAALSQQNPVALQRRETALTVYNIREGRVVYLTGIVRGYLSSVRYRSAKAAFQRCQTMMMVGGGLVALGIVGFVITLNASKPSDATEISPGRVQVRFFENGRELFSERCARTLASSTIDAILLSRKDGIAEVVTLPTEYCPESVRVRVAANLGFVRPPAGD